MKQMKKEIIVYSPGNPDDLATWSNVPYFFCKTLENQNIKVDKVDISVKKDIFTLPIIVYSKIKEKILQKIFDKNTEYSFFRNKLFNKIMLSKMKKRDKKYPNADIQVVFDFSHVITNKKKFIMLCDWTIEYYIREHLRRSPNKYEMKLIQEQYNEMSKSNAIISIFPESYKQIKEYFPNKTFYFGHVVNSLAKYKDNRLNQFNKRNVLFIGNIKYIKGLEFLIAAINKYNSDCNTSNEKLTLNVIGIERTQVKSDLNCDFCKFYGYLNKTDLEDRKKYYTILCNSRVVVNPTANWNGASSLFESLYLGVPIIVSPNIEIKTLLKDQRFCDFCDPTSIESLEEKLKNTFTENFKVFANKSLEAHNFAKQYTWDKFIEKFNNLIDSIN